MNKQNATNITWHEAQIKREKKEKLLGQKGLLLWFTGLSASGKSTLAHKLEMELYNSGKLSIVLDGDNIRHGLNKNLGFSSEDRKENIRRIGEVAKLFVETGVITMASFISPYRADRDRVKSLFQEGDFIEIYVKCPLDELERRDPKGLYKKAREGVIKEFTGISAPYEEPVAPEIVLDTFRLSIEECAKILFDDIVRRGIPH